MDDELRDLKARRVIRRARIIAGLLPLGSLLLLAGGPAVVNKIGLHDLFPRLLSPLTLLLLGLFYLIYLPATVRIYYILLLGAQGVFKAPERRKYQGLKRKWDKILLKSSLAAGILTLLLAVYVRLIR